MPISSRKSFAYSCSLLVWLYVELYRFKDNESVLFELVLYLTLDCVHTGVNGKKWHLIRFLWFASNRGTMKFIVVWYKMVDFDLSFCEDIDISVNILRSIQIICWHFPPIEHISTDEWKASAQRKCWRQLFGWNNWFSRFRSIYSTVYAIFTQFLLILHWTHKENNSFLLVSRFYLQ